MDNAYESAPSKGGERVRGRHRKNRALPQAAAHIIVIVLLLMVMLPIYLLIVKSFKTATQDVNSPFTPTFPLLWDNYYIGWLNVKDLILNTLLIAAGQTVGVVLISAIAAYGFTRYNFPGKNVLFMAILSLMMVPGILSLIPQYKMVIDTFGMENSFIGVILPSVAGGLPLGIFLLKTFFNGLPKDLFEAAEIDGAGSVLQFIVVALPLSIPILATLGLMSFMGAWNDLLWPKLILQDESMHTISIGLVSFTDDFYNKVGSLGPPFAGYVIVSLPLIIIFFFTSKQFIKGLTSGAFKM